MIKADVFWVSKANQTRKYDAVVIGDSRALRGINPDELKIFDSSYNFAFRSLELTTNFINESLKLLKGQNSYLIIALSPNSLVKIDEPNQHYFEYKNISLEDRIIRSNIQISKYFSPIRSQKFNKKSTPKYQKTFYENGFIATNLNQREIEKGINTYKERFKLLDIDPNKIDRILNLLRATHKRVIFFRMPSCKEMELIENRLSGFKEASIREKIEKYEMKWLELPNRYKYKTYDASHLTPNSAKRFSKDLNELISKYLDNSF